jgi:hypothetical protein
MLSEGKRNEVLALAEVEQYGRDSFGDPDYVHIYGLKPADWYARGIRILGRTAVECTRDRLADAIACDVAAVAKSAADITGVVAVDPFAGSANTLFWIACRLRARCVGFELDESIFETSVGNLAAVGADVELVHGDYATGLGVFASILTSC